MPVRRVAVRRARAENDPALALGYRNRAAELYRAVVDELGEEVAKDPDDPWTSLPWVFASVRLAQVDAARGAVESARGLLRAALPVLHALRPHALADHWDEAAATAAAALARELDVEPAPR